VIDYLSSLQEARHRAPLITIVAVTLSTTFAVLPPLLLGATSPLIRDEFFFDHTSLGLTVALFFLVSAIASPAGGFIVRWIGISGAITASALVVLASLLTIGVASDSWGSLTALFALAGLGNALAQPAANEALAYRIPQSRQGLAFGVKQAAIPFAALLAGLAIPTLALSFGWRTTFVVGSLLPILLLLPTFRLNLAASGSPPMIDKTRERRGMTLPLLTLAFGCGTAAASCVAVFLIESAVADGIPLREAGALFAINSGLGIAARVTYGWAADRWEPRHFVFIAVLLGAGSLGAVALSFGTIHPLFWGGSVLAFVGGWSWNGLFNLAIVKSFPASPAVATGIVLAGGFGGSALGPLSFGFRVAWLAVAGIAAVAAALMMGGRSILARATDPGDEIRR